MVPDREAVDPLLIGRKHFLRLGGLGVAALVLGTGAEQGPALARPDFREYPFKLGVASGNPLPDGVVIWTRLAPYPLNGGGMPRRNVEVTWKVAEDERFRRVVRKGTALARPGAAHTVHVDVRGLRPRREYFYRFRAGDEWSPVGRTKTAPAFGAPVSSLAFAFASCQDWENGLYAAYEAMSREELDFVVHLGDYIYENGAQTGGPRQHNGAEIFTLEDYRNRHALYKSDPKLRKVHALFPWMVTWDDHEADNDYADENQEDGQDPRLFLRRRAAAYKAYYEHMPLRPFSLPRGPDMRLYRTLPLGDLAQISLLDTRQYRTDQPCGDGLQERCAAALSESQTMSGPTQEKWLLEKLGRSQSRWNVIAQQTMLAEFDFNPAPGQGLYNMDQWDGYVAARNRLLSFLQKRRPSNPITITGDIHSSWVHDLKADFDDPTSETLGTEFVGTSISSSFPSAFVSPVEAALTDNPHTKFFDGAFRGYVRCDLNRERWRTTFRGVPSEPPNGSVLTDDAPAFDVATFVVEDGQPGAVQDGDIPTPDAYEGPSRRFDPDELD